MDYGMGVFDHRQLRVFYSRGILARQYQWLTFFLSDRTWPGLTQRVTFNFRRIWTGLTTPC
jgi:hypothetical protein